MTPRIVHGTPITPRRLLAQLAGGSFCVSFARPEQLEDAIALQGADGILLLDNGAFSTWKTTGAPIDRAAFFAWANDAQARSPVAVAVVPDIIGGDESANWIEAAYAVRELSDFPERLCFVWHMNDSLARLKEAAALFNFVAIGSCAEYDVQTNRRAYMARLRAASAQLDYVEHWYGRRPWVHLMRGLAVLKDCVRFESADSSNIARNHCRTKREPDHVRTMAARIAAPIALAAAAAPRSSHGSPSNFGDSPEPQFSPDVEARLRAVSARIAAEIAQLDAPQLAPQLA